MSSINNSTYAAGQTNVYHSTKATGKNSATASSSASRTGSGDTVEISDAAKALLENGPAEEPWQPFSFMEYEKVLTTGSEEEKAYRELLKSVKEQKSDVMSLVEDAIKKSGVSLEGKGKLKLEVSDAGKIRVSGISDRKTALALEKALNRDKSLAQKLQQYQKDEKELSKQISQYTGCTLYELTMTAAGDINERVKEVVEAQVPEDAEKPTDQFYTLLGFLGETRGTGTPGAVVDLQDVYDLTFGGSIDFSSETNVVAEPERNIKQSLEDTYRKVKEEFEAINNELAERMKASGVEVDEEFKKKYFLDASRVTITVDSLGGVQVDGLFADDESTHKKGSEVLNRLVNEMLNYTEDNSYHINIFTEASEAMIRNMTEDLGEEEDMGWDTKVVAEIANGVVGDVRVSSPRTEQKFVAEVQDTVNRMLEDSGIATEQAVAIEIDDSGKIRATNLSENDANYDRILALLDDINADVEKTGGGAYDKESAAKNGRFESWEERIGLIADRVGKLKTLRG